MRKTITPTYSVVIGVCLVMLQGCMVGPKYKRPVTVIEPADTFVNAGSYRQDPNSVDAIDNWWLQFGDATTTDLVRRALGNNYELKAAAARVLQAKAALDQARGVKLPDVSYNLARNRNKMSFAFGPERFSNISTTWSQNISVGYILDLFGNLRHSERAAWADLLAAGANQQALTNSIIATVIRARIEIATMQKRLDIARKNTVSRKKTLQIVQNRYNQGLVGPVDIRLARERLAAAQAAQPAIELSLAIALHALDVLLAQRPGISSDLPHSLPDLPDLAPLNVGVPVSLLDRRPDVLAAEMSLRAANDRIGVSMANMYPNITLSASIGRNADTWHEMWRNETEVYSAVMQLAQPIFEGGQLRAQVRASKARYEELAAVYASVVINAIREVEDALVSGQLLQRQLEHVKVQFEQAVAAEQLADQRYERGIETILTVLETQRSRIAAEEALAVLRGNLWTTRVNIYLALGGDWTTRENDSNK